MSIESGSIHDNNESQSITNNERIINYLLSKSINQDIEAVSDEDLITQVVEAVTSYADENMYGMQVLALNNIPIYLRAVVSEERLQSLLLIWEDFIQEFIEKTEGSKSKSPTKIPRKIKKTLKKSEENRRPSEREKAEKFAKRNKSNKFI